MQTPHRCRGWQVLLLSVGLFALVFAVFSPALQNGFVGYDDPQYVTANWHVQQGLTWEGFKWAFASFDAANWHPLTWLSHELDTQLFGMRAWGHHLTSLCLHALNGSLLFVVLRALTGATWRSLAVALLFAIHPLRVESVAWVSERKDVLSGCFFLLTLWAWRCWSEGHAGPVLLNCPAVSSKVVPDEGLKSGRRRWEKYLLALVFYALGLMSKPMLVTLPFVLLLLDYWPGGRFASGQMRVSVRVALLEKTPFFVMAFAASAVTVLAQQRGGAIIDDTPLPGRLANALVSYARYMGKLLWPADLSPFYPAIPDWPALTVLGSALLLLGILVPAILLRRRLPFVIVGWLWFLGMLVPVIGLVQAGEQAMADRYSYLPSIGLLILLVWVAYEILACLQSAAADTESRDRSLVAQVRSLVAQVVNLLFRRLPTCRTFEASGASETPPTGSRRNSRLATCATVVLVCALAALAALTRTQISFWRDTATLFAHVLRLDPGNYLALNNLGTLADREGRSQDAISLFTQALRRKPGYAQARNNLGAVLLKTGRVDEAIEQFQLTLKTAPGYAEAHNHLGVALDRQGRSEDALRHFAAACTLNPSHADARYNLGLQLMRQGRLVESIPHLQAAIRLQPASADTHNNLGFVFQRLQQPQAAIAAYRRAIELRPDYALAHFNLGVTWFEIGRVDEAIHEFRAALKIKPDYVEAQKNLKTLLELKR